MKKREKTPEAAQSGASLSVLRLRLPAAGLVLLAGRPCIGKTAIACEMADELQLRGGRPAVLFLARSDTHRATAYRNGKTVEEESRFDVCRRLFPDVRFLADDTVRGRMPAELEKLLSEVIARERPDVLFLGRTGCAPVRFSMNRVLAALHGLAKKNGILIIAECGVRRTVEKRADRHPSRRFLPFSRRAQRHADAAVYVYRDSYYNIGNEREETVEVYTETQKTVIPFRREKYLPGIAAVPSGTGFSAANPHARRVRTGGIV